MNSRKVGSKIIKVRLPAARRRPHVPDKKRDRVCAGEWQYCPSLAAGSCGWCPRVGPPRIPPLAGAASRLLFAKLIINKISRRAACFRWSEHGMLQHEKYLQTVIWGCCKNGFEDGWLLNNNRNSANKKVDGRGKNRNVKDDVKNDWKRLFK